MKNILNSSLFIVLLLVYFFSGKSSFIFGQTTPSMTISFAKFNVLHSDKTTFEMRMEYRKFNSSAFVSPFGGIMANMQGAFDVYAGIMKDIRLFGNLYFTPSFAPSIYIRGQSKDLSFALEFRSQVELAYQFSNGLRIGINFNHVSNGGLRLPNVGVESLGISYVIPIPLVADYLSN